MLEYGSEKGQGREVLEMMEVVRETEAERLLHGEEHIPHCAVCFWFLDVPLVQCVAKKGVPPVPDSLRLVILIRWDSTWIVLTCTKGEKAGCSTLAIVRSFSFCCKIACCSSSSRRSCRL